MFLLRILRWIAGYVVFTIQGSGQERFLNLCARCGYTVWNIKRTDCFFVSIARSKYRLLKNPARQTGVKIRVYRKCGLPFLLGKLPNFRSMAVGLGVFALVLCFLSTRVWSIRVQGNERINADLLLLTAEEMGLKEGMARQKLDTLELQNRLMLSYPQIAWISLNTRGSTVTVCIGEKEDKPEIWNSDSKIMNITAAKDGQVIYVEATHGTPQVKAGDGVAKGQLLVSGITETKYSNLFTRATARVIARVKHNYELSVPLQQEVLEPTGTVIIRYALRLFGCTVPVTLETQPQNHDDFVYERALSIHRLQTEQAALPATVYEERWTESRKTMVEYTPEQALDQALDKLEQQRQAEMLEGTRIVTSEITHAVENGQLVLRAQEIWEENIAQETEIYIET